MCFYRLWINPQVGISQLRIRSLDVRETIKDIKLDKSSSGDIPAEDYVIRC